MSRGLNRVMLIGHLGRDPEMRTTPSGRPVTTFLLATSRAWHSTDGERHEDTEWFNIVAWGSLAEICQEHLRKGQRVYVEGRLQTRRWDDGEGRKHQSVEIVAREMIILGDPKDGPLPAGDDEPEHDEPAPPRRPVEALRSSAAEGDAG